MTRDERGWPILAVIGALVTIYVIYALATGRVRSKSPMPIIVRAQNPSNFWLAIGVYSFAALACWYFVAKALLDSAAQP